MDYKATYTEILSNLKAERQPIDDQIKELQSKKTTFDIQIKQLEGMVKQLENPIAPIKKRRVVNRTKKTDTPK